MSDLFKTISGPKKDFVYNASMGFAQLIRESNPNEIKSVLDIVKATLKGLSQAKNKKI